MGIMLSRKLRESRPGVYQHWCPGCGTRHSFDVGQPNRGGHQWAWNGDAVRPTFTPSMHLLSTSSVAEGDELKAQLVELARGKRSGIPSVTHTLCHYFLTDGRITYCADTPHRLSGQTIDLPDFPGWVKPPATTEEL